MIGIFLQVQQHNYFHYLIYAIGKTFAEVIKVGEMVESGIKSGKIVSQAVLKATTQVLQNGSGNLGGKKRRGDVATILSGPWTYVQENHPQHYFPSQTPQYPWRAPTPQNHPPPPPPKKIFHQNTTRIPYHPIPEYKNEMELRKISSLRMRNLDYFQRYTHCSNSPGNDIERCWYFKRVIQDLIDTHGIIVKILNGPSINKKSLSMHIETNMLEMMNDNEEFAVPYKPTPKVETNIENLTNVVGLTKKVHPEAQKILEKLSPSNTSILTMKRAFEDVWASQRKAKMGMSKPILIIQGAYIPL
ncbi:hypothetical protein KY289_011076 [Solanum tuberosum]|nr:hypothetical protein KY289_011076 [Solanum tuberosum]